ncbi:MAG TPA: IucA/IucC family protein [Polyangiaceae bacterium]|nr:IucA/IucC family protein [Polyangiaceae bacterium]
MTSPTLDDLAHKIAGNASFQALANCYLREVDGGTWHAASAFRSRNDAPFSGDESYVVDLALATGSRLALGVSYRSLVGRHTISRVCRRDREEAGGQVVWRRVDPLSAQLALIDSIYAQRPNSAQRLALLGRVIESNQVMTRYVEHALESTPSTDGFIGSEQSTALGHWLHPTPKSRQGLYDWQHRHYAPELAGCFQLHFFAARRELLLDESIAEVGGTRVSGAELARRLALTGLDSSSPLRDLQSRGFELLPVHPLQAHWLAHQDHVRALLGSGALQDLGPLGPLFTPTSSVRTLYSEATDFMIKLSIPVTITNSLRINLRSELGDSVWLSQLFRACDLARDFPQLLPIEDPAYLSLALPDRQETGFEAIFRSNPFRSGSPTRVDSIAALVQEPLRPGERSKLHAWVSRRSDHAALSEREAAIEWFEAYLTCAIETPLRIYDRHGIALEGHQQNVLLELDASGLPSRSYCRDIQGLALAASRREQLTQLVPELARQPKVFEDDDIVRNGIGYYLVFNQLYSVINRLGLDALLDETSALDITRRRLEALSVEFGPLGKALLDTLLGEPRIACKANLLTRIEDMDELQSENELAVYSLVPNPLCRAAIVL